MGKYLTKWYRTTNDLYNVINIKTEWPLASRRSFFHWVHYFFCFEILLLFLSAYNNKATSHIEDISVLTIIKQIAQQM